MNRRQFIALTGAAGVAPVAVAGEVVPRHGSYWYDREVRLDYGFKPYGALVSVEHPNLCAPLVSYYDPKWWREGQKWRIIQVCFQQMIVEQPGNGVMGVQCETEVYTRHYLYRGVELGGSSCLYRRSDGAVCSLVIPERRFHPLASRWVQTGILP